MDRKRGIQSRPAASEETNVWNQARTQLIAFSKMYSSPTTTETIGRVNRLISVWPSDDTVPAEGLEDIQHTHNKLRAGLRDIDTTSNNEVKAIEQALEKIGVLIALRQAPEPVIDKRNKRPRAPSPSSSTSHGAQSATASRGVSITLPPRNAAGTPLGTVSARSGSRKDYMGRQLPLRPGRNIAFFPPPKRDQEEESSDWILAVITRCINSEKNKYEVRDVDEENPETYTTTLKFMIPLPDPGAAPGSPESLSSYPEHAKGSTVLALYPDTSCFYRAVVVNPPDHQKAEMDKTTPAYVLRFEDDGEQTQVCMAYYVVEAPKE